MGIGIKSKNAKITLDNVTIRGFDKAVSLENSKLNLLNSNINHNRIGLESINSQSLIYNSTFHDNAIDIVADNSSIQSINSVVKDVIINNMDQMIKTGSDVRTNPFQIKAQASNVLKTRNPAQKRKKFKKLLKQIQVYAGYATQFYSLLKIVLAILGIHLP